MAAATMLAAFGGTSAHAAYWNVFNVEGESNLTADIVTYATLADMLNDTNRTGVFSPNTGGAGRNVVGSGSDGTSYWNIFNVEGESNLTADVVTYATLADMLNDTNRTGVLSPNTGGAGRNVVGSGSNGTSFWNVFNVEDENNLTADIVTYASLSDMLNDTNRTGVFSPNTGGAGRNVVGSGSDGTSYWNVFNVEGESNLTADIVTYATLSDMLNDTNRTGVFSPNTGGAGRNVVGSGSDVVRNGLPVPEPATLGLFGVAIATLACARRRRARRS